MTFCHIQHSIGSINRCLCLACSACAQTGSGKTFTITGGPVHYADRGIIPRTISHIFTEVTKRADHQFAVGLRCTH